MGDKVIVVIHRVNKIEELKEIDPKYGVEIDIRHNNKNGRLYLNHDPGEGDDFEEYLRIFSEQGNKFVISNIKEAGIEQNVINLASKYGVENYFLLDVEFPFIFRAVNSGKIKGLKPVENLNGRLAIRYSEAEPAENALQFAGIFKWIWIDTNTRLPLNKDVYSKLINAGYKLALVCPERWGRPEDIPKYIKQMKREGIRIDAVMTGRAYVNQWEESGVLKPFF